MKKFTVNLEVVVEAEDVGNAVQTVTECTRVLPGSVAWPASGLSLFGRVSAVHILDAYPELPEETHEPQD